MDNRHEKIETTGTYGPVDSEQQNDKDMLTASASAKHKVHPAAIKQQTKAYLSNRHHWLRLVRSDIAKAFTILLTAKIFFQTDAAVCSRLIRSDIIANRKKCRTWLISLKRPSSINSWIMV
jgi:hypothetical protein